MKTFQVSNELQRALDGCDECNWSGGELFDHCDKCCRTITEAMLDCNHGSSKLFIFSHPGMWLGGFTAVISHREPEAKQLARKVLKHVPGCSKVSAKDMQKIHELEINHHLAVNIWNGDY